MSQTVVWPAVLLQEDQHEDFRQWVKENLDGVVGTVEQVITLPDKDENGNYVRDTGGRTDVFFTVEEGTNMGVFAIKRLQVGMRWWEDVLANGHGSIYPQEVHEKYKATW